MRSDVTGILASWINAQRGVVALFGHPHSEALHWHFVG